MSIMTFWSGGSSPCAIANKEQLPECEPDPSRPWVGNADTADLRDEHTWVTMRGLRDGDPLDVNLLAADSMFRATGLPSFVKYHKLWDGALWPYRANMSWSEGWQWSLQSIANFSAQIKPWVANGTVSTIFLGDELCCPHGCQETFGSGLPKSLTEVNFTRNATAILRELRKALGGGRGRPPLFYLNTCPDWQPERWPADLDLNSTDIYDPMDARQDWVRNRDFYHNDLYPRLGPSTRALVVPFVAAGGCASIDNPSSCAKQHKPCRALAPQEEQNLERVRNFD